MAFQRLRKTTKRLGDQPATITIGSNSPRAAASRQVYLSLSAKTRQMLGDPAAFVLDFDPDAWQLRISAAPADDPDALKIGKSPRVGITTMAREIGFVWDVPVTVTVRAVGRSAVIGDFSEVRTVTPIKRGRVA